jgi:hypothetical protein
MKKTIFALFVVAMFSTSANAFSGNDLVKEWKEYKACEEKQKDAKGWKFCEGGGDHYTGYVEGVIDAAMLFDNVPANVTLSQKCSIVGKWLETHPEKWHEPADRLVVAAIISAFPLKKK